jgi:hypothetical protein
VEKILKNTSAAWSNLPLIVLLTMVLTCAARVATGDIRKLWLWAPWSNLLQDLNIPQGTSDPNLAKKSRCRKEIIPTIPAAWFPKGNAVRPVTLERSIALPSAPEARNRLRAAKLTNSPFASKNVIA